MAFNPNLRPDCGNPAIGVYEERAASGRHTQNRTGTVRSNDLLRSVWNHRERQFELIDELLLYSWLICAYAHHEGVEGLELRTVLLEVLRLVGSTRGICAGIKVDRDPLALLIAQLEVTRRSRLHINLWSWIANL